MIKISNNLQTFFEDKLKNLSCDIYTKSYIVGTLSQYKNCYNDMSDQSLTLLYHNAKYCQNFIDFQHIGDWIFFCESILPGSLNNASREYYHSLAQISYYKCYLLLNRQMLFYESLADRFTQLTKETQSLLNNLYKLDGSV